MRRDERIAVEMPGQLGFTYLLREYDLISSGDNVIGGYPVALVREAGDVDLADYKTVFLKRRFSASRVPFSAIIWWFENTISCVDSEGAALLYTYPQASRAEVEETSSRL